MKYIKISMSILVIAVVISFVSTLAYYSPDEVPIHGTLSVSSLSYDKTAEKNKINYEPEAIEITETTDSNKTKFTVRLYIDGGEYDSGNVNLNEVGEFGKDFIELGRTYMEVKSKDLALFKFTIGYHYDPNRIII